MLMNRFPNVTWRARVTCSLINQRNKSIDTNPDIRTTRSFYRLLPASCALLSPRWRSPLEAREMLLLVLGALLLLFCTLDVWYFLRGAQVFFEAWFLPRVTDILTEQTIEGTVLPHDLDYMGHMNNSRYLRECDFARFHHYMRNGLFMASRKLGAKMVVGASTIRYRRSLAFREVFEIRTKVLGWDEKAFYLEQRFVSKRDGFVSAIMLCRQNVVHSSPEKIIEFICKKKIECPEFPEDLKHWISYITASSQALRAESGLDNKNK